MFSYTFHWNQALRALPQLLDGALVTLEIALLSMASGLRVAMALTRLPAFADNRILSGIATAWVESGAQHAGPLPDLHGAFRPRQFRYHLSPFTALLAGIAFNNAGYLAENFRGALKAIPDTQARAGRSLGMSPLQAFRLHRAATDAARRLSASHQPDGLGDPDDLARRDRRHEHGSRRRDAGAERGSFRTFEFFALAAVIYYLIAKAVTLAARLHRLRACSATEAGLPCSDTALSWSDLAFLAQGAAHDARRDGGLGRLPAPCSASCLASCVSRFGPYWSIAAHLCCWIFSARCRCSSSWCSATRLAVDREARLAALHHVLRGAVALYGRLLHGDRARRDRRRAGDNTRRAARSLGMTWWQDMRYIVAPLATRVSLPSWIGLTLGVMKDSALVLWLGLIELLRASQILVTRLQEPLFILLMCGAIYFVISLPIARFGRLSRRTLVTQ
jgi:ABC-type amino acid transport system permease subunit